MKDMKEMYVPKKMNRRNKAGFTLIETIVAVAVLLGAIAGPVTLVARALFSAPFSRNGLIGYNLAQEGIELARAIRDDIAICDTLGAADVTNVGPLAPGNWSLASNYYEFDAFHSTTITCGSQTISVPRPAIRTAATCNTPLRTTINGEYTYTTGTATNFTRCVRVCAPTDMPCTIAPPAPESVDSDIPAADQTEIISTVSWIERGAPKSITLRDRLYNWQ